MKIIYDPTKVTLKTTENEQTAAHSHNRVTLSQKKKIIMVHQSIKKRV